MTSTQPVYQCEQCEQCELGDGRDLKRANAAVGNVPTAAI